MSTARGWAVEPVGRPLRTSAAFSSRAAKSCHVPNVGVGNGEVATLESCKGRLTRCSTRLRTDGLRNLQHAGSLAQTVRRQAAVPGDERHLPHVPQRPQEFVEAYDVGEAQHRVGSVASLHRRSPVSRSCSSSSRLRPSRPGQDSDNRRKYGWLNRFNIRRRCHGMRVSFLTSPRDRRSS